MLGNTKIQLGSKANPTSSAGALLRAGSIGYRFANVASSIGKLSELTDKVCDELAKNIHAMARQQGDVASYIAEHMNPMLGANGKAKADEIVAYLTAQGIIKDGKLQSDKILNPNPDYATNANIKESALFKLSFSSLGISSDVEYKLKEKLAKLAQSQSKDYAAQSENLKQNTSNAIQTSISNKLKSNVLQPLMGMAATDKIRSNMTNELITIGNNLANGQKITSEDLGRAAKNSFKIWGAAKTPDTQKKEAALNEQADRIREEILKYEQEERAKVIEANRKAPAKLSNRVKEDSKPANDNAKPGNKSKHVAANDNTKSSDTKGSKQPKPASSSNSELVESNKQKILQTISDTQKKLTPFFSNNNGQAVQPQSSESQLGKTERYDSDGLLMTTREDTVRTLGNVIKIVANTNNAIQTFENNNPNLVAYAPVIRITGVTTIGAAYGLSVGGPLGAAIGGGAGFVGSLVSEVVGQVINATVGDKITAGMEFLSEKSKKTLPGIFTSVTEDKAKEFPPGLFRILSFLSSIKGVPKQISALKQTAKPNVSPNESNINHHPTTDSNVTPGVKPEHNIPTAPDKVIDKFDYIEHNGVKYDNFKAAQWKAPKGTEQTYKVYQRNDIDWDMVRTDTKGPLEYRGKTNREAALAGHTPQLADGNFVTIHHIGQNVKGPLVETTTKIHSFKNKEGFQPLHNQFPGKKHPEFPVDHSAWAKEQKEYWKWRVNNGK